MNPANTLQGEYFEYQENEQQIKSDEPAGRVQQVIATVRSFATLSELLRILGAAIMIGGMSLFLMKGWEVGNDIQRYFMLLTQTLLLTAGGFALSALLKEYKGARLFFGLSLVSVTANFTILGALIYSLVQFDGLLTKYPGYATWVVNDPSNVFLTILLAAVVLVPVTWFAFSILARSSARWLTAAYIGVNALLLLPVRSSIVSTALACIAVVGVLAIVKTKLIKDEKSKTNEGRFAQWVLFTPIVILLFRSWYFYNVSDVAIGILGGLIYLALRQTALRRNVDSRLRTGVDLLAAPLTVAVPYFLVRGIEHITPDNLLLPLFALGISMLACDLLARFKGTILRAVLGVTGAIWIGAAVILNELMHPGVLPSLLGFAVLLATMAGAYWIKSRTMFFITAGALAWTALINFGEILRWIDLTNWLFLSIAGASVIVAASLLERFGATLKIRFDQLRESRAMS